MLLPEGPRTEHGPPATSPTGAWGQGRAKPRTSSVLRSSDHRKMLTPQSTWLGSSPASFTCAQETQT